MRVDIRPWFPLLFVLLCSVAAPPGCGSPEPPGIPPPIVGPDGRLAQSVDFSLTQVDGRPFRLSDLRGQVVLVAYFATWCDPCLVEVPAFNALVEGSDAVKGLAVVGVALDLDGRQIVEPFVKYMNIKYTVALADESTLNGRTPFGPVQAIPVSFLVDAAGRHVESFVGLTPIDYVRRRARELVEENR